MSFIHLKVHVKITVSNLRIYLCKMPIDILTVDETFQGSKTPLEHHVCIDKVTGKRSLHKHVLKCLKNQNYFLN